MAPRTKVREVAVGREKERKQENLKHVQRKTEQERERQEGEAREREKEREKEMERRRRKRRGQGGETKMSALYMEEPLRKGSPASGWKVQGWGQGMPGKD